MLKSSKTVETVIFVIMKNSTDMPKAVHHGRNVKRIREILGIKQDALAASLGEEWNQRRISVLEDKEVIETALLEQIAEVLKVPVDAIKSFNEDAAISIIANTITNNDQSSVVNFQCSFNPIEKWLEAIDENKRLYEALLKSEREKVVMLEKILENKK